jgi:hypothetical protein
MAQSLAQGILAPGFVPNHLSVVTFSKKALGCAARANDNRL